MLTSDPSSYRGEERARKSERGQTATKERFEKEKETKEKRKKNSEEGQKGTRETRTQS